MNMQYEQFQAFIQQTGPASSNIDEIEATDDKQWAIGMSSGTAVLIDWLSEPSRLVFSTLVGRPPVDRRFIVYESLLTYNSLWHKTEGTRMALDGTDGEVIVAFEWHIDDEALENFDDVLSRFVDFAILWCNYVTLEYSENGAEIPPMMMMTMLA